MNHETENDEALDLWREGLDALVEIARNEVRGQALALERVWRMIDHHRHDAKSWEELQQAPGSAAVRINDHIDRGGERMPGRVVELETLAEEALTRDARARGR